MVTEARICQQVMSAYSGDVKLKDAEWLDLHMGFERLLAVREAIKRFLGLKETPRVVLTAGAKKVVETARLMGYGDNKAFLWDDNR